MITYFTVTLNNGTYNIESIDNNNKLDIEYVKTKLEGLSLVFEYGTLTNQCTLITADNQVVVNTSSDIFLDYNPLTLEKL